MKAVTVEDLSKTFMQDRKKVFALRDVSLEVESKDIFGLLGPNGAGKTTLINVLIGLLTPTEGRASIFGLDASKERYKTAEIINFASHESNFHWVLSVKEILDFYGKVYGLSKLERKEKINFLVKKFELQDSLDNRFGWLSSGQKMRVVLAKSMINDPKLILLDEPTAGLDPDIAKKVRSLITEINKDFGVTVLLTSHYMTEVEQLCDKIAFINRGEIIDVGSVDKVKSLRFSTFKIMIKLQKLKDKKFLKNFGFKIFEDGIVKTLKSEEELSPILDTLVKKNYKIVDIKTQKPTLEDYFLKMVEKK